MPLYTYSCPLCFHKDSLFRPIDLRDKENCPKCGMRMDRPVEAPQLKLFNVRYFENLPSPKWIHSTGELAEECKKQGVTSDELPL